MASLAGYLDELKKAKGLKTDSELARLLKVSRGHVSQIRGGMYMGEVKCFELAKLLKIEPIMLLSLNQSLRAKDKAVKKYWLSIHHSLSSQTLS